LEKGSTITFDIQKLFETDQQLGFAIGKSDEEAKALSGEFSFEVDKVSRVAPAKIDQTLFDKALGEGKVKTEAEFRDEVKKIISENYNRESEYLLDFDIEKALIASVNIDLPDEFLKNWLVQINEGKFTAEDVEKDYEAFAKGLRADLIKSEIAANNDIKVDYDDVLAEVKAEIMNYFGQQAQMQGMEDFVDQMARKQLSENKDEVFKKHYNKAYGRKVIEFAKTKVKTTDREVQVEEFNEIAKSKYELAQ
jgi:trigger factor